MWFDLTDWMDEIHLTSHSLSLSSFSLFCLFCPYHSIPLHLTMLRYTCLTSIYQSRQPHLPVRCVLCCTVCVRCLLGRIIPSMNSILNLSNRIISIIWRRLNYHGIIFCECTLSTPPYSPRHPPSLLLYFLPCFLFWLFGLFFNTFFMKSIKLNFLWFQNSFFIVLAYTYVRTKKVVGKETTHTHKFIEYLSVKINWSI